MAKFYGEFINDQFKRQMKENRKIEELILKFATHATTVLKKEPSLAEEGWKAELNNQLSLFVKLLRESLRSLNVTPELLGRLDMYTAKLTPSPAPANDSGYDTSSNRDSVASTSLTISGNVSDMRMVKVVAALFKLPENAVQQEVDSARQICTEKVSHVGNHISAATHTVSRRPSQISR